MLIKTAGWDQGGGCWGLGGGGRGVGVQLQKQPVLSRSGGFQSVAGENRCWLNASVFPRAVNIVSHFLTSAAKSEHANALVLKLAFAVGPEGSASLRVVALWVCLSRA